MNFKPSFSDRFSDFYVKHEYAIILSIVLLWQAVMFSFSNGFFFETDNYTHALRLFDMIQSGSWKEVVYRHDNCPFGQTLHFSRITDIFLYLTTLPFLPFMELKKAIFSGSFLYNPFIACLSSAAFIWIGRAFLPAKFRFFGIFFYFSIGGILSIFAAGRPDHHVLLNLFLILQSGCLIYGAKTQKNAYYKTAGIFAGLSIWTSPEGLLACFFIFWGMICAWLLKCQNMRQIRLFSQFTFIASLIFLIINPPIQGLFYPDNGKLSFLTVVILGLAFLSFYAEEFFEKKFRWNSLKKRFFSLSSCALFSVLSLLLIFGKETLFSPPIPAELNIIWTQNIRELKPYPFNEMFVFFYLLIFGFFSCFCAPLIIKKLQITFLVPFVSFLLLTSFAGRFSRPCSIFACFTLLLSLGAMQAHIPFFQKKSSVVFMIFLLAAIYTNENLSFCKSLRKQQNMAMIPTEYIPYIPQDKGCLLAHNDFGPEISWWTGRSVVGSNYHTNAQGIIDNYTILNSTDTNAVVDLLKKRNVSTIVLNRIVLKNDFSEHSDLDKNSFAARLFFEKETFCFIKPVDLPDSIKEKYLIYSVDFKECKNETK